MILNIVLLVIGFIILIKGADFFVDGASGIAGNFKVSKMVIGLTIVAFGTSAPEFAVSVKSLLVGNGDMILGNVIGSNILNILLILGLSAIPLAPSTNKSAPLIKITKPTIKIIIFFIIFSSQKIKTDPLMDQVSLKYYVFLYSGFIKSN